MTGLCCVQAQSSDFAPQAKCRKTAADLAVRYPLLSSAIPQGPPSCDPDARPAVSGRGVSKGPGTDRHDHANLQPRWPHPNPALWDGARSNRRRDTPTEMLKIDELHSAYERAGSGSPLLLR
jgi:hypothetical protein